MADQDDAIIKEELVIIDFEDHVKKAEYQLKNKDAYKILERDPT